MKTERQFGFLIIPEQNTKVEDYLELKASLEGLIHSIAQKATYYDIKNMCTACRLENGRFFTIRIKDSAPLIAVYEAKEKKLYHEYSYQDFKEIFEKYKNIILYTLEDNVSQQKGGVFQWSELHNSWNKWFSQLESTKNPETSSEELQQIAMNNFLHEETCINIASHKNINKNTIIGLSQNPYVSVKIALLQNPKIGLKLSYRLIKSPEIKQYFSLHPGIEKTINAIILQKEAKLTLKNNQTFHR